MSLLAAWWVGPARRRARLAGLAAAASLGLVSACSSGPSGEFHQPAVGVQGPTTLPPGQPDCATTTAASMTLAEQVGQLILIGAPVDDSASVVDTVRTYHVGGVFLAGRSTISADNLHAALRQLQAAAGPVGLQIAVDQEGGEVQTLTGPGFPTFPTALRQGQWSTSTLRAQTLDWASRLDKAGITMDLAPVADTVPPGTASSNPPIGQLDREYGSNPTAVATDIATVVTAAQSTGIITTLKHFPGLGRVTTNTDFGTGATDDVATTHDPFLQPFASGIHAGTGAVMISLASYPKLDSQSIAAFSPAIVTNLLRGQLGFQGVIVSDDLGAAVAVSSVPMGQRAVKFIEAGGDMALSVRTSDAELMSQALLAQAQSSATFAATVAAAATKVLASKVKLGLVTCNP
jgi:beta-N-acetylhexosaminidase